MSMSGIEQTLRATSASHSSSSIVSRTTTGRCATASSTGLSASELSARSNSVQRVTAAQKLSRML